MDILSHTILYADDIKIIVTSTNYNNLYKTLNVTHQLISEWLHMKQLVLNKNKTFAISISCVKSPTHTLNIIRNNQNLTLTESTDFLCTHLDTNLSWTLTGKIIEETEYSMQFDKEFILLSDSTLITDSFFAHFQPLLQFEIIFCSSPTNLNKKLIK